MENDPPGEEVGDVHANGAACGDLGGRGLRPGISG